MLRDDLARPSELPHCCVPGCAVVEPGVGDQTCVIWGGRRLCYAVHFPVFVNHPLSFACDERGMGPTESEWAEFVSGLARCAA